MDGKTIVETWLHQRWPTASFSLWQAWEDLAQRIDDTIAQSRAEEREACAEIVDAAVMSDHMVTFGQLADAIRRREP